MSGDASEETPAIRPRRRVARKRKKETRTGIIGEWFKIRLQRIGESLLFPKSTFKQIVKDPDYGGMLIIALSCVLLGLLAQYTLWVVKLRFYDIDQHRYVSLEFPYTNYATSEAMSFLLFSLLLNFAVYYVASWALKGQRNATAMLVCTGYVLSPQLLGRIFQLGVSFAFFPPVEYKVSADTVLVLMTTSIQLFQIHQRGWAEVAMVNERVFQNWQITPEVLSFRFATYLFNIWTAVLAVVAVKYAAKLSWKKAAVVSCIVFAKDTIFFIQSFLP